MKYTFTEKPTIRRLFIYWRWKVLQRIFWYCSARRYYRISDFVKTKTKLNETGKFTVIVETTDNELKRL